MAGHHAPGVVHAFSRARALTRRFGSSTKAHRELRSVHHRCHGFASSRTPARAAVNLRTTSCRRGAGHAGPRRRPPAGRGGGRSARRAGDAGRRRGPQAPAPDHAGAARHVDARSALMLEAMRAGVNECVAEPLQAAESSTRRSRGCSAKAAGRAGPGLRLHRRQGRRRHDDRGGQRRDRAGDAPPAVGRCSSTCTSRTATPPCSSASNRASRWSTRSKTSIASTTAFFKGLVVQTAAGVDLLASSDERLVAGQHRCSGVRTLVEFAASALPLHRARRAALGRRRARRARVGVADRAWSPTRSWRRCATPAGMAAALRQRYGSDRLTVVRQPRRRARRDRPARTSSGSSAARSRTRFRATTGRRSQALNKGRPLALDNHNELRGRFRELRARARRRRARQRPAAPRVERAVRPC